MWTLSDGGFERRVVFGTVSRQHSDVDVTAFDMETLRERRGEWAYLPIDRPFRIGGVVSVVVCETDRALRHVLLKREGQGDDLVQDDVFDQMSHVAKAARVGRIGLQRLSPGD